MALTPAHEIAEHFIKDIGEARATAAKATCATAAIFKRCVTKLVVGGALLIVLQDIIGFVDFLEFMFRRIITLITIRVILHGHLAIGLL